jgi:hypothetical protein
MMTPHPAFGHLLPARGEKDSKVERRREAAGEGR